jgi:fibronectin-binding autotransporter adhesin
MVDNGILALDLNMPAGTLNLTAILTTNGSTTANIQGSGGVQDLMSGTLIMNVVNSYTGATEIDNGTMSVANLGNPGANSDLGNSTASAGELVLNGGSLLYTGPLLSTTRLFTLMSAAASSQAAPAR